MALSPRRGLAAVLALGALAQIGMWAASAGDPLALAPINDAKVYWDWGGRIADGQLVDSVPFMSAPLYPYVVGLVRSLGGGLSALYLVQMALHVLTAWLVARVARRHVGEWGAVLAAGLYLVLRDPAYMTTRVLNSTVQLCTIAWLWDATWCAVEARTRRALVWCGVASGVAVLANPTLVPVLVVLPVWLGWRTGAWRAAAAAGLMGVACLVPSVVHNALACGEFIPLSAQSGLGLHHGNQPGATGIYQAAAGVSTDRERQTLMAREAVRDQTDGTWSATDKVYRQMALTYLTEDLGRTVLLEARKLWWFVGGQVYGDVYTPSLEREDGRHALLWLAPLPLAWLTVPALLVALLVLVTRPRVLLPEWLLFAATVAVVMVFWYSPRYRLPIAPFAAVAAAWCVVRLLDRATPVVLRGTIGLAVVASLVASAELRASGADAATAFRATYLYNSGVAYAQLERWDEALREFERASAAGSRESVGAQAEMLRRLGRTADAVARAQAAVEQAPKNLNARRSLAVALAQAGRLSEAAMVFEQVLAADATDVESLTGLGHVRMQSQDPAAAVPLYERALQLQPAEAQTQLALGRALAALGNATAAQAAFERALALDARTAPAHTALAELALARGDVVTALVHLRAAWEARPAVDEALTLAWWLVVAPEVSTHDAELALRVLQAHDATQKADPRYLDVRAAALARRGSWNEAQQTIAKALERARALQLNQALPDLEARAALYARQQPYTLP